MVLKGGYWGTVVVLRQEWLLDALDDSDREEENEEYRVRG